LAARRSNYSGVVLPPQARIAGRLTFQPVARFRPSGGFHQHRPGVWRVCHIRGRKSRRPIENLCMHDSGSNDQPVRAGALHVTRAPPARATNLRDLQSDAGLDSAICLQFFGSERRRKLELGGGPRPETDKFGQEPALVARCCSPAKLLGFPKLVGTPRCNDARRCHQCDWHSSIASLRASLSVFRHR